MEEQFYTILTSSGKAKIANSNVLGSKLNLAKFQVGDGGGAYYNPTEDQTQLKNKVWEGNINSIRVDKDNPSWIVIEVVIPTNEGGFMIREAGIVDADGDLIAIGKYPETFKPHIDNGSSKDLFMRMILEISNTENVTLKVDPTVIMATKKDVEVLDNKLKKLEKDICEGKITSFKTDVQNTKLENCAGGFVNINSIQGQTLVNLSKLTTVTSDNVSFISKNEKENLSSSRNLTIVNQTGKTIYANIYVNGSYSRVIKCENVLTNVVTLRNEIVSYIIGRFESGWTDTNKNELLKVMILEGDWTNRIIPNYFDGMLSVSEDNKYLGDNLMANASFVYTDSVPILNTHPNMLPHGRVVQGVDLEQYAGATIQIVNNIGANMALFFNTYTDANDYYFLQDGKTYTINLKPNQFILQIYGMGDRNFGVNSTRDINNLSVKVVYNRIEILSTTENLAYLKDGVNYISNGTIATSDLNVLNSDNSISAVAGRSQTFGRGIKVYLQIGKPYTISTTSKQASDGSSSKIYIAQTDTNLVFNEATEINKSVSFTPTSTPVVIEFARNGNTNINAPSIFKNIMLVEGSVAKPYIEANQNKTEIFLQRGLDEFSKISSDGVVTWGGQFILNGTEDIYIDSVLTNTMRVRVRIQNLNSKAEKIIVDKFSYVADYNLDAEHCYTTQSDLWLFINKSKLATQDVAGVKQFLASNNVTGVYDKLDSAKTIENLNKTLNLRAYDNLIVKSGDIQPQVNYSYAKNTGERISSIEDAVENVKDKVDTLNEKEITILQPVNGYMNWSTDINLIEIDGNTVTLSIALDPKNVLFPFDGDTPMLILPPKYIPKNRRRNNFVATDKGTMTLNITNDGFVRQNDMKTTEKPTWIIGTITYSL